MAHEEMTEKIPANEVVDSLNDVDQGIIKDWDDEEAGVRRKWVQRNDIEPVH